MDDLDNYLCPVVVCLSVKPTRHQVVFSNAARSPLDNVTLAGHLSNSAGVPPFRKFGQFALVYLLDGSGRYRDATGLDRVVGPGDLIIVFPNIPHAYGPGTGEHWTEFYLCFNGPVFDLWQSQRLLDPARPIHHLEPIHEWLSKLEAVLGAPRRTGFAPPLLEVCRLQQILADIVCGTGPAGAADDWKWAARACALLEADLDRALDVRDLASRMGMGYESFRKRFTRVVGQPPAQYRCARLIDRACDLIQRGGLTDKEIASTLGFCDEFYFSRRFRQITGQSPRQFRQRLSRI